MALHPKLIDRCSIIHPDLSLLGVVPHPHTYVVVATITPDVVWHLKPNDKYPHVKFPGSFSQGMGAHEFVQPPDLWVVVGGVV